MTVMAIDPSEPFGTQERVGEVDHQPHGHDTGERIIEEHERLLTADRRRWCNRPTARRSRARRRRGLCPAWQCSEQWIVPCVSQAFGGSRYARASERLASLCCVHTRLAAITPGIAVIARI